MSSIRSAAPVVPVALVLFLARAASAQTAPAPGDAAPAPASAQPAPTEPTEPAAGSPPAAAPPPASTASGSAKVTIDAHPILTALPGPAPTTSAAPPPASSGEVAPSATSKTDDSNGALDKAAREKIAWLEHLKIGGYIQPQLLLVWNNAAASSNLVGGSLPAGVGSNSTVAKADGTTTNNDYFRLRRARVKVEYMPTDAARFVMELDPTPTGGPSAGVGTLARNVEAVGIIHWGDFGTTDFGVGIFKIPFGYEVLQSDADRPFIERSWSENNLTPGEFDTGARAYSSFLDKKLNVQLAIVNGVTQGEKTFAIVPDVNKGKDFVGRVNYDFGPFDVGMSGIVGQGQIIDPAGLRFKNLPRKAINFEAGVHHELVKALGQTRLNAEVTRAQNLDRGTKYAFGLPAIPSNITSGSIADLDELGYFLRIEQDMTKWFTLALRYDYYTPNSAEGNNGRDTFGAVAVVHFTKGLEWRAEVAHATDNVHKPLGAAPHKLIDTFSNVLQARF